MLPPGNFFRKRPALEMSMISSFLVLRFCTESRNYYISTVKSVKNSFIIFRSLFQSHAPLKPFEDRLETRAPIRLLAALLQRPRRFPVLFPFFPLQQVRLNTTLLGDRPCFPTALRNEVRSPPPSAKGRPIRPLPLSPWLLPALQPRHLQASPPPVPAPSSQRTFVHFLSAHLEPSSPLS